MSVIYMPRGGGGGTPDLIGYGGGGVSLGLLFHGTFRKIKNLKGILK